MKLEPDREDNSERVRAARDEEIGDKWVDVSASQAAAIENKAYDTAIRVIEAEASHCALVAADEKDWLPLRASAFEKSETMNRCAAIIRTLKHT